MQLKFKLLSVAILLATTPQVIYAKTGDPGERIGTAIVAVVVIVIFLAIVNWLKSKKK